MNIIINGKKEQLDLDKISVLELLKVKEVKMPETVSVQLNGVFVNQDDYESTYVENDNEIDFLYFMGGGK